MAAMIPWKTLFCRTKFEICWMQRNWKSDKEFWTNAACHRLINQFLTSQFHTYWRTKCHGSLLNRRNWRKQEHFAILFKMVLWPKTVKQKSNTKPKPTTTNDNSRFQVLHFLDIPLYSPDTGNHNNFSFKINAFHFQRLNPRPGFKLKWLHNPKSQQEKKRHKTIH